jgi:hypothetical protein
MAPTWTCSCEARDRHHPADRHLHQRRGREHRRDAYERGYQQVFVVDAMAARSAAEHEHTVQARLSPHRPGADRRGGHRRAGTGWLTRVLGGTA